MSASIPKWLEAGTTNRPYVQQVLSLLQEREAKRDLARAMSRPHGHPAHIPPLSITSEKSNSRFAAFFKRISSSSSTPESDTGITDHYSVSTGASAANKRFNRYMDIEPYNHTIVTLDSGSDPSNPRYLNANWVQEKYGGQTWIASQAPLPTTAHAFLSMIIEKQVKGVVQLTRNVESGIQKAHEYFPTTVGENMTLHPEPAHSHLPPVTVTLLESVSSDEACCLKSQIRITSQALSSESETPTSVEFTHFFFHAWPDHGVPAEDHRASLVSFIRLVDQHPGEGPMVVGCSAGVGRTGSYIALCSLLRAHGALSPASYTIYPPENREPWLGPITKDPDIPEQLKLMIQDDEVVQEIDSLRDQRPSMVQRSEQALLVYQVLRDVLES